MVESNIQHPTPNRETDTTAPAPTNRLSELQLPISVVLGRADLPIKEVLKITPSSVIELDKEVGEDVELLVHGTVIARGEIVLVKGNYGLRITQIAGRGDRLSLCQDEG